MYIIYFLDGSSWRGGNINNSKWNEAPNKPIAKIEYRLFEQQIILENYEYYNHITSRNNLNGVSNILLMGLKKGLISIVDFDLKNKTMKKEEKLLGKEYNEGPTTGWKRGI